MSKGRDRAKRIITKKLGLWGFLLALVAFGYCQDVGGQPDIARRMVFGLGFDKSSDGNFRILKVHRFTPDDRCNLPRSLFRGINIFFPMSGKNSVEVPFGSVGHSGDFGSARFLEEGFLFNSRFYAESPFLQIDMHLNSENGGAFDVVNGTVSSHKDQHDSVIVEPNSISYDSAKNREIFTKFSCDDLRQFFFGCIDGNFATDEVYKRTEFEEYSSFRLGFLADDTMPNTSNDKSVIDHLGLADYSLFPGIRVHRCVSPDDYSGWHYVDQYGRCFTAARDCEAQKSKQCPKWKMWIW